MFGDKLKARREEKGLSQDDVADFFGENFSRQAVSKWERGLSVPDAGMLVRIAGALDTTVNDLLGEEEPEQGRDLAAELEALNRQLAEMVGRVGGYDVRRRWRAFFAAVGILALWGGRDARRGPDPVAAGTASFRCAGHRRRRQGHRHLGRPPVGTVAAPAADGGRGPGGGGGTVEDPEKIERRTR